MKSPEDKYQDIERIERQLREKETELRLQNKIGEINAQDANYKTVKHQPEASETVRQKKVVLGLKLFAIAVVAIVAVKVASVLAGIVIVGLLTFVGYKLFFSSKK